MKCKAVWQASALAYTLTMTTACVDEPPAERVYPSGPAVLAEPKDDGMDMPSDVEPDDVFEGALTDESAGLMWMRCEFGLSYNETIHWCVGENVTIEYCASQDNSCNGDTDQGELALDGGSALVEACDSLNLDGGVGGFADWRVPTVDELVTMYETVYRNAADELPNTRPSWYWSSTSETNRNALIVSFETGEIGSYPKSGQYPVRCVRDL